MPLTQPPLQRMLPEPGQPFVVYAIWGRGHGGQDHPADTVSSQESICFAAANLPGGPLGEFAVSGSLARPLVSVYTDELPIALSLRLATILAPDGSVDRGEWVFDFLGQADRFPDIWRIPPEVQPNAPTPLTPEELNQGAEDQIRESLGIPPDQPIPHPIGTLSPEEQAEEPYRFDPTPHLDLTKADPPLPLPPPQTTQHGALDLSKAEAPPAIPERVKGDRHGGYGDRSIPFAH